MSKTLRKTGKTNGANEYEVVEDGQVVGYLWRDKIRGSSARYIWWLDGVDGEADRHFDTFKEAKAAVLA